MLHLPSAALHEGQAHDVGVGFNLGSHQHSCTSFWLIIKTHCAILMFTVS
jgi:hypothetical protein